MAIVTDKPIPPICFIHVENLKAGGIIVTPLKVSQSVRPPTHHEVSECKRAKPALTPAGKWPESHHVTTSSSSAGGNLTATNATASDSGIVQVDIEAEETSPEASSSSEPVAARDSRDLIRNGEDVDILAKPNAGGGQLISGSPSDRKAPDFEDNTTLDWNIDTDGEDSKQVLGETFKPESLECENGAHQNSTQLFYCSYCAKKPSSSRHHVRAKRADYQTNN